MRDHPPTPLTPTDVVEAGHRGESSLVMRAAAHPDPRLRHAAVGSFHRLGELDQARLLTALADDEALVRHRACEVAARWVVESHPVSPDPDGGVGAVIDALVVRLGDTDDTVAEVAAFALGETGTPDSPPPPAHVVDALETMATSHEVHLCREAAVAALGALGVGRATILAALGDRATVRRRAVIALAPFEGPDVDAALERALDDRDWQVRQAAEDLLTITADGERAVEADAGTADETET